MHMYNLIEYRDNSSDFQEGYGLKRDETEGGVDLTVGGNHIPNNSSSFKYKSNLITNRNDVIKHLSNLWRSL